MAEGIAGVIMAHWSRSTHTDRKPSVDKCDGCGEVILTWGEGVDANEALAAHQADVLAANGYGKLEDAWADGHERGFWNGRLSQLEVPYGTQAPLIGRNDAEANNPYRRPE